MDDLFASLAGHTHGEMDRHGECHIACPKCKHPSSPRTPHCSFNAYGWHCFVCGEGGSLANLSNLVGLESGRYAAPVRPPKPPQKPATWLANTEHMIEKYTAHRASWTLWRAYKPVSREDYELHRLGVGVLPLSKCHHERLIVPIYDGTMCVGLRGRRINCDCAKWLAPGGTLISLYPLYNQAAIYPGCTAAIVENPIDALLISRIAGVVGLATYSVAYWQERWSEALRDARRIEVMYDNDVPGRTAGIKLANRLNRDGLRAFFFSWPENTPAKYDVGDMLTNYAGG